MNRMYSHLDEVDMIGKLADLKLEHAQYALLLDAVIELLTEKNILTQEEIAAKTEALAFNPSGIHPKA